MSSQIFLIYVLGTGHSSMEIMYGQLFIFIMNKYEVLQKIGQGEYGEVLKARNKETNELVAIKKFKDDDNDEEAKKIILRQVKILKMMNHENITQFKDAFRKKARVYLVCQFVERNLLQVIDENKGIQRDRLKQYLFQIIKGISYMHSIELIHRDIKPENILINSDHSLKICDFGFARVYPPVFGEMTDYVATRWYRPPELLLGVSNYDQSVDVWAVGCLFGQMIDGEPVFPGQTTIDQLYLIQKLLGTMIPDHEQLFSKNPKFVGMKFPQLSFTDSLQRRYLAKIGKQGIDLMKKIFKMDPKQRITAAEALKHPFFNRIKPRLTQSPIAIDSLFQKPKTSSGPGVNNHTLRDKQQFGMLGINKIKGIIKQQPQQMYSMPKSKIMLNVHNKQTPTTSLQKNQKAFSQTKKQSLQLKKKIQQRDPYQNYVQQFEEEQFVDAAMSKPKQITRHKKRGQVQQEQGERFAPKTPLLTKLKVKKKISKYDYEQQYDGPNIGFQRRRKDQGNVYNIVFNNNTHNYSQKY